MFICKTLFWILWHPWYPCGPPTKPWLKWAQEILKSSRNKKNLNDAKVAGFSWFFFAAGSLENDTENGAAVMSLRFFLFCDDFSKDSKEKTKKKT